MIFYSQNPKLGIKTVKTFDGKKEYRTNCRKMKDKYYVKGVDCLIINNRWYLKSSKLIYYDHELETYCLRGKKIPRGVIQGIVGVKDDKLLLGYFTENLFNNCMVMWEGNTLTALNHLILAENDFIEHISTGVWHYKKHCSANLLRDCKTISNKINHGKQGYNIEDNEYEYGLKKELFSKYPMKLSKDVRRFARFLGDTTFGLEVECSQGYLPPHIQNRTGLIICRDGSLNGGPEFTSIPLEGAKGLQNIANMCNELHYRTTIDTNCAFHLHIGNVPTSRIFLVSFFRLCQKIQEEVFMMFPLYNIKWKGIKAKGYCQPLPNKVGKIVEKNKDREHFEEYVSHNYTKIFTFLSEGVEPSIQVNRKLKVHPQQQKWNRHTRYYWANLMNTIFSDRNTIEFRLHTPTTNSQKMINWLFICNAIVKYAMTHPKEILTGNNKITLDDVLDYYKTFGSETGRFLSEYLKTYVKERTERFQKDWMKGDLISQWEIEEDKIYQFKYGNVSHLF